MATQERNINIAVGISSALPVAIAKSAKAAEAAACSRYR
jgi:hypothetical protein